MSVKLKYLSILFLSLLLARCEKEEPVTPVSTGFEDCLGASYTNGDIESLSDSEIAITSRLTSIGTEQIVQHGHLLKKGQIPTIDDYDDISFLGEKSVASNFRSTFSDLDHSSKYYIVAYISYDSGTCYHSDFGTVDTPVKTFPQVRTLDFTARENGIVDVTAVIDNTYGKPVSRWGFIYTAGSNMPDFDNAVIVVGEDLTTGVISHSFSASVNDLDSDRIYTISAFAENDAGISVAEPIKIHRYDFDFCQYDLPGSTFTNVLNETFADDSNNWYEGESSTGVVFDLRSGYYRIAATDDNSGQTTFNNPENILEGLDNYQIDVVLDFVGGTDEEDSYSGLRFEGTDSFQEYFFGIKENEFILGYWNTLDVWETIIYGDTNEDVGNNVMTVRKVYGSFCLYINGNQVHTFDDFDYNGSTVRVRAGRGTTIDFEELTVRKIL